LTKESLISQIGTIIENLTSGILILSLEWDMSNLTIGLLWMGAFIFIKNIELKR